MARVPQSGEGRHPAPAPGDVRWEDHFCPACGKPQKAFPRYPWYICQHCLDLATDYAGRRLVFSNSTIFGGLTWYYADDPTLLNSHSAYVLCFIRKRLVDVREARFGGVVAQPLSEGWSIERYNKEYLADLRFASGVEKAREWLKPAVEHPMNQDYRPPSKPIEIDPKWRTMKPKSKPDGQ